MINSETKKEFSKRFWWADNNGKTDLLAFLISELKHLQKSLPARTFPDEMLEFSLNWNDTQESALAEISNQTVRGMKTLLQAHIDELSKLKDGIIK